jgi:hypothetical protein
MERLLEAPFHQPLADILHRLRAAPKCVSDLLIGPVRAIRVGLQQNLSPPHLLAGAFQLLHHRQQLAPLLIRQAYDILLVHPTRA